MIPTCPRCERQALALDVAALTDSVDDVVLRFHNSNLATLRKSGGATFRCEDLDPEALTRCTSCGLEDQLVRFMFSPRARKDHRAACGYDEKGALEGIRTRRQTPSTRGMRGKIGGPTRVKS